MKTLRGTLPPAHAFSFSFLYAHLTIRFECFYLLSEVCGKASRHFLGTFHLLPLRLRFDFLNFEVKDRVKCLSLSS